ncbi:sensor histidine kinase [Leptothrix discophora]|uniref:histidine kinase n=1 Tax=Leptothrix discophora TaxID=89 RepID=A0ABT9G2B3_LEPDI|nr:HAMP domain-containing sensor histidine kinase [Leptothrix discophora]MDP4300628.1 HAMP domain-containing sensor histidine kinase [Leptothrix discophora]
MPRPTLTAAAAADAITPARAQELVRAVAAASHDLRQPMHAIGLLVHALRARPLDGTSAGIVGQLGATLAALEHQIDDLLDYSRGATGALQAQSVPLRLGELYQRLQPVLQPMAFDRGLDLRWRGGHLRVEADPRLLERVLRNLIGNAVRYTDDGGVLISARRRGSDVLLQVWDSGIGLGEDEMQRLFEPGYRGAAVVRRPGEARRGVGLGLSIVRQMVEAMGLGLALRSTPGRGSVFTVVLPLALEP